MHPIETERLILRDFEPDDAHAIYRIVDEQLGWGAVDPEERWTRIQESYRRHQDPGFDLGEKAVVLRESDEIIGVCGVYSRIDVYGQFPSLAHADAHLASDLTSVELGLGYSLDPAHWGNGYAPEACRALTAHIFEVIRPHRIVALTAADNHNSRRVMEKLGMHIERNISGADWPGYAGILYGDRQTAAG